jgi:hypothetical protein
MQSDPKPSLEQLQRELSLCPRHIVSLDGIDYQTWSLPHLPFHGKTMRPPNEEEHEQFIDLILFAPDGVMTRWAVRDDYLYLEEAIGDKIYRGPPMKALHTTGVFLLQQPLSEDCRMLEVVRGHVLSTREYRLCLN